MQCILCGGTTQPRLIETDMRVAGRTVWLTDVPADVCVACGEPYFELAIYDQMERDAREQVRR